MRSEVVVITGASAGVGRATAREFARRGARIGLIARDRRRLETAAGEVEALGGRALVCVCDVSNPQEVELAAQKLEAELGPIDIWINNAMVSVFSPVKETQPEEYEQVTKVTYLGAVYGTLAALKRMLPRDHGTILQIGSALAYRSIPLQSAYCAAKHALSGFTESLRCEILHDGSRVNVTEVHLPALNTPQFAWVKSRLPNKPQPVPPIFQPEVAARAIYWCAHQRRREVRVGWPTTKAAIADKLVPGLADRYLAKIGYSAQQSNEPADNNRANNLFQSVPGDYGAHGEFDHRAKEYSLQFTLTKYRDAILTGMVAALGAFFWVRKSRAVRLADRLERADELRLAV
jgi:short-subunit dehydrogenase